MQPDEGTPTPGETANPGATEPVATPQAPGNEVTPTEPVNEPAPVEPEGVVDPAALASQLEAERKERQKVEMERNQLRKKQEELDQAAELKRQEDLSEVERLQEQVAKFEEVENRRKAEDFRQSVIDKYDDEATKQVAKAMIAANESNLLWGDVASFDEAETQLIAQLDALKATLPVASAEGGTAPGPGVSPNNAAPIGEAPADREEMIKKAAEKRDFSEVFKTIPSVQAMVTAMKDGE